METELDSLIEIDMQKRRRTLTLSAILMCALAAIFYCYEYYLRVAPSVMAAELKSSFNLSDAAFGNLFACYYYAYTPMQIPVGVMLDRYGPRRILTLACLLCAVGTYLFANTEQLMMAQFGRFVVGFGSAFAYVGVLKISDSWLPKKYFALMVGVATALGMLGAMTGELTMAYMVERMGWQATLSWSVIAGVILTIFLVLVLKDSHHGPNSKDDKPKLQSQAKHLNSHNLTVWQGLCKIFMSKTMWVNGIIGCLLFLPITVFAELWAVPYLQSLGFSKGEAAFGSSMVFIGFAIGGPCWGFVSDAIQNRKFTLVVGAFFSALFLSICILLPNPSAFWIYGLLFLSSFAASSQILIFAIANDMTASSITATAVAFTNMVVMLGGALLPQVIGKILDYSMVIKDGMNIAGTENYQAALMIIPIGLLLASLLSLFLKESYIKHVDIS